MQQARLPAILLVEDNTDDYEATIRSLARAGLENPVHWCTSGKEALDYLRHDGAYAGVRNVQPALVLLDLNMPGLSGKKTLELIKQNEALKKIPVLILTTSDNETDIQQCYELGANTYIQKPMRFEEFVRLIRRIKDYWFDLARLPGEITAWQ